MKPQENAHNLAKPFDFTHCETARITLRHGPLRSVIRDILADEMGRFGAGSGGFGAENVAQFV